MYSATRTSDKLPSSRSAHTCCHFSLAEIRSAAKDFDDELVIGHGGFGKVYKGQIFSEDSSHTVAIKRLDSMSNQGEIEFRAEIEMLSQLRHSHLVSLIGFCDANKEMILIYEYMPNGTLYHHLHKADTPLSWVQRMKIVIGAGRGLDYLHTGVGTQHGVIHRDVKSSNILLDENWEAMIADFGLSKIGPTNQSSSYVDASVKGTFGYLDPEYFYTRKLTSKTDVYAFGVVLFELLSGRFAVDERNEEEECSLVRWAQKCVKERKLDQMVDSKIRGTIIPKCLKQFAQIAVRCVLSVPKECPTMTEVVGSLHASLELHVKCDVSVKAPSTMGFPWKFHKLLISTTKRNSEQRSTSSPKNLENNRNQCSSVNEDVHSHGEMPHQQGERVAPYVKKFTYEELKLATRNFMDTYLGLERYGDVFKCWVDKTIYSPCEDDTGLTIAVKKLLHYKHFDLGRLKEFHHPNLVQLIGYCLEGEHLFLVYEFMHNGNFENLLRSGAVAECPLVTKVKIALGIARGIVFLHQTRHEVSESLLDRRKILLDKNFTAKLSDYDISILVHGHYPRVPGYVDDFYFPGFPTLSEPFESGLSGFEVVFTEVITGEQISNLMELVTIKNFLSRCGKEYFTRTAKICYKSCNEVDIESKMVTLLQEYDELIRTRLKSWLVQYGKW